MAVELVVMIVLTILSAVASYLLRPKLGSPVQDQKPANLVNRGDFVRWVVGRRRVGALIGWIGAHSTKREGSSGKGGSGADARVTIHYESSMHIICIGPAQKLHGIFANGRRIFKGPITRESHPSGTNVNAYKDGSFDIYWGEVDQPVNTYLGNKASFGVASGWPYLCYVNWKKFRLGQVRQWPVMDYEIETHPVISLSDSPPWFPGTYSLSVPTHDVTAVVNGGPGVASITIAGKLTSRYAPGRFLELTNNPAAGTYAILSSSILKVYLGDPTYLTEFYTVVLLNTTLTGADVSGEISVYRSNNDDGVNHAHALFQLLFAPYPHGIGLSQENWDIESLEAVGELVVAEGLRGAFLSEGGENALGQLAAIMQDLGLLISWNTISGKYQILPQREPFPPIDEITADMILSDLPEIETLHGASTTTRLVFSYPDRRQNFKNGTINVDDDGATETQHKVSSKTISIPTIIDFETASKVSERRAQEELGPSSQFKITSNREARVLVPGTPFIADGFPQVLRVLTNEFSPLSDRVTMECITDFYGLPASTFETSESAPIIEELAAEQDDATNFIEVPTYLSPGEMSLIVPRIRAHSEIESAFIHFSRDDSTYTNVGEDDIYISGGILKQPLDISADTYLVQGPQFTVLGPDIDLVLDQTGDDENWRLGRQFAVIGDEVFFLQKVTAFNPTDYRLDGLIRARYDTEKATHPTGSPVYIFQIDGIYTWQDILLQPGKVLYVKTQPFAGDGVSLDEVQSVNKTLIGKGIAPMKPANLRTTNMMNIFNSGADIPLKWSYRSALLPKTGAGMQGAGDPVASSPVDGEFVLRFKDTSDVVKREVSAILVPEYTYTNAELVSDFGSEPTSLKISLTNINGGLSSPEVEITVDRLN